MQHIYFDSSRGFWKPNGEEADSGKKKWVLHFWKPTPIKWSAPYAHEWVPKFLSRSIALGLHLELDVGEWLGDTLRKEQEVLSEIPYAKELLGANARDENGHYKGFVYASDVFPVSQTDIKAAKTLEQSWVHSKEAPILKAYALECGVFLVNLALIRTFGGLSLFDLGTAIQVDERRHVTTNGTFSKELGYLKDLRNLRPLIIETLNYLFGDLNLDYTGTDGHTYKLTEGKVRQWVTELFAGGSSELDQLNRTCREAMPFELANSVTYARSEYALQE